MRLSRRMLDTRPRGLSGGPVTEITIFFQGLADDGLQTRRQIGIQPRWQPGLFMENGIE
jgi:hypothetical protein